MLAVLEYQKGDCAAATAHFEKAASLFESKLPALHAYGTCLVKLKRFDKAAEVFRTSLALNPDDARERQDSRIGSNDGAPATASDRHA